MSKPHTIPYSFAKRFQIVMDDRASATEVITSGIDSAPTRRVRVTAKTPPEAYLELRRVLGCALQFDVVDSEAFESLLAEIYEQQSGAAQKAADAADENIDIAKLAASIPLTEDLLERDDNSPIVRLINAVLLQALQEGASDIHLETFESQVTVRFRIDGILRVVLEPQRALAQLLVSRIKVMAELDIAEKRLPQDGRISIRIGQREVDIRVSTIPTRHGERVVLRLLEKSDRHIDLNHLGMSPEGLVTLRSLIALPHGVILVTGPTGSGKSTTLYGALSYLNSGERNILTIEDPIEYDIEGVGQMQVNSKAGMTFARGLRALLRQDPDVVMIGEIRDAETAEIAIQASMTGHLVFSTLHTNTALGAIARLTDMGVEPFLLSASVAGLIAQRLVRVLCPACKAPYHASDEDKRLLSTARKKRAEPLSSESDVELFHPVGCAACFYQGYRGRTGVYEIIPVTEEMRPLIHRQASEQELIQSIRPQYTSMFQDGADKVIAGITSLDELMRVVHA